MKVAVCANAGGVAEVQWAKQWAGLDPAVKSQFPNVDWGIRSPQVVWITALDWPAIVAAITQAAGAAGANGLVVVVSGHGGSACVKNDKLIPRCPDTELGICNFDPTEPPGTKRGWDSLHVGKGLFFDHDVVTYTDNIPFGNPPTLKEKDELSISSRTGDWQVFTKRREAWEALQKIGNTLRRQSVRRITFTVCSIGGSPGFVDKLAKQCGSEVATFKFLTAAGQDQSGKARLILLRDPPGRGTNIDEARVYSPDLDDPSISYVGHP